METGKNEILITGGTGLVGSRIVELLSDVFNFIQINRTVGIDISDTSTFQKIPDNNSRFVIHLAAKADVDGCEAEKEKGNDSEAWKINVLGTKNIVDYCQKTRKKLLFFSTDFIFNGEKKEGEYYTEEDEPGPINYYSQTKFEAEKIILESEIPFLILRIAYPYRGNFELRKDFVRAIADRLNENLEIRAVVDHIMCPTFIDDLATAVKDLIQMNEKGIYHVVGSQPISPYDAALEIAREFGLDSKLIQKTTRNEYFQGKAKRPFNLYLKNDKIENLGITMKTFSEGLHQIKI